MDAASKAPAHALLKPVAKPVGQAAGQPAQSPLSQPRNLWTPRLQTLRAALQGLSPRVGVVGLGLYVFGCGGPAEAQDPRDILGSELAYDAEDAERGPAQPPDPLDRVASEAECRQAFTHIHELGAENAARAETDPELARKIRAGAKSVQAKAAIERDVKRCLTENVSAREARCYAHIKLASNEQAQEAEFERCSVYQ